jgi:hypothetical protein
MRPVIAVMLLFAATGCAFGEEKQRVADRASFVADLIRLGRDGEFGVVGLAPAGKKTRVLIEVFDPPSGPQAAEIRRGNCDVLDGATAYRLTPVSDGFSETTVDVSLQHLRRTGYAVLVGIPATHLGGLCGDLYRSQPPGAAPTFD